MWSLLLSFFLLLLFYVETDAVSILCLIITIILTPSGKFEGEKNVY